LIEFTLLEMPVSSITKNTFQVAVRKWWNDPFYSDGLETQCTNNVPEPNVTSELWYNLLLLLKVRSFYWSWIPWNQHLESPLFLCVYDISFMNLNFGNIH